VTGRPDAAMSETSDPVIQPENWTDKIDVDACFPKQQPLEIDIGCGKGRFLLARAASHPNVNYLGIERLLVRARKVAARVTRAELSNVRLLRVEASYALEHLLPPLSARTLYISFPDPWPKRRHHRRRLLSPQFVDLIVKTLRRDGQVHLTTDHVDYLNGSHAMFTHDSRFEEIPPFIPNEAEQTHFEILFQGQGCPIGRRSYVKVSD